MPFLRLYLHRKRNFKSLIVALVISSVVSSMPSRVARAQSLNEEGLAQEGLGTQATTDNWNVNLGLGLGIQPIYPGAAGYHVRPIPLISINYGDLFFLGTSGVGINAIDWNGLRVGPVIGFVGGRNQSDDSRLYGLGNISASITAGIFANYQFGPFELAGTLRQAVTNSNNGLLGLVRLDYRVPIIAQGWELTVGPDLEFANTRYDETWFGVSQTQSSQSGLPTYSPGAGVKDVGFRLNLTYYYTEHVLLRTFASVEQLTGDDANSPVVQSKTQGLIGFGVAYHF